MVNTGRGDRPTAPIRSATGANSISGPSSSRSLIFAVGAGVSIYIQPEKREDALRMEPPSRS